MTILDCCISLKMIKKNLVVLGVVDMRQLLLNTSLTNFVCLDLKLHNWSTYCAWKCLLTRANRPQKKNSFIFKGFQMPTLRTKRLQHKRFRFCFALFFRHFFSLPGFFIKSNDCNLNTYLFFFFASFLLIYLFNIFRASLEYETLSLNIVDQLTLLTSGSEWPFDQA